MARPTKHTDGEAIEEVMALRARQERWEQTARAHLERGSRAGALYAQSRALAIGGQIRDRLARWHKAAKRRQQ